MISSVPFNVRVPNEKYEQIRESIRLYRAVARQVFSACAMAEMAGAKIAADAEGNIKVKSNGSAKGILATAFGKDGAAHLYQCRDWVLTSLAPSWHSFVWDSLRRDVSKRWGTKDPENPKATRGWLIMNGARNIAHFNNIGIGFPVATARPKINGHKVVLKWDSVIGSVEFTIPRLDGHRNYILKCLREKTDGWKLGTMYLNERDKKLYIIVSHVRPDRKTDLDEKRALTVEFTNDVENFITLSTEKRFTADKVSATEVRAWLDELEIIRKKYVSRKAAIGNPHKKWGSTKIHKVICKRFHGYTVRRANGQKTRNDLWTRRVIGHAERTRSGRIVVQGLPKKELFGHPWGWYQFKQFLNYKAKEIGVEVSYV